MSAATTYLVTAGLMLGLILAPMAGPASATLNLFTAFQNAALSIDGGTDPKGGTNANLQTDVPNGATVLAAFLYVSDVNGSNPTPTGSVTLAGNVLNLSTFTKLGPNESAANHYRLNVTSIMKPIIEGTFGLQTHTYTESNFMDGAVLVVAYRTAATTGTAIILDGELAQAGDVTTLTFGSPYTSGAVIMSLASSFSFNGSGSGTNPTPVGQVTVVDVTTSSNATPRVLSQCAGGNDDGDFIGANGQLITVGGVGDSTGNPHPQCTGGGGDDELYDLSQGNAVDSTPFLTAGDTSITFNTNNPSFDDNVFGLFFTSSIQVTEVDDQTIPTDDGPTDDGPPPTGVPYPATLLLLGAGLLGTAIAARKRS
ncbi:MAG TPA: PEP-CTERM sorting domain-containing protein [Methylomirabilota bacterium]|nr:PEP-CTERM sorting domain-containing protein [Methylomirabilota bacterium]